MIGSILGDIIGSSMEYYGNKTKDFDMFSIDKTFTDDTVMTLAVFTALEKCNGNYSELTEIVSNEFIKWYNKYPNPMGGYGASFENWCLETISKGIIQPAYNSCGNGAAMRISPVAYFARDLEECKNLSRAVTEVTHNHPEGIKGAEAVSIAIFLALHGKSRKEISEYIRENYYVMDKTCNEIRKDYQFESTCQKTVPESITAFLEATSFDDSIRIVVSLGGDADTMAAITGALSEAYFGIPEFTEEKIKEFINPEIQSIVNRMKEKRDNVANRYLTTNGEMFKEGFFFARHCGSNMDGYADSWQTNYMMRYEGKIYLCRKASNFIVKTENEEHLMTPSEFQFFIDEIKVFLHRRYNQIWKVRVEDFYRTTFIKLSNGYWYEQEWKDE